MLRLGSTVRWQWRWQWLAACLLALAVSASHAGLSVQTRWGSLPPTSAANQRTVDFDGQSLAGEGGRLSHWQSTAGCDQIPVLGLQRDIVGYVLGVPIYSFTPVINWVCALGSWGGNVDYAGDLQVTSGVNNGASSATIRFNNQTPYVGFLWRTQFNAENTQFIRLTLEDGNVVTLKNCRNARDWTCVGAFVPSNWLQDIYNLLLGWLLGDAIQYHTVYVQYQPDNGVRISQVQFETYACRYCGFLSGKTSQDLVIDQLTYVDATVAPHHLRVTTRASTSAVNEDVVYTVTACGNADCSQPYVAGVTGTLTFSGASPSTPDRGFSILAGPNNTATVTMRYQASGAGTVGMSAYSPTPSNTPTVFCGMGATASSGGSCVVTVGAVLHHLEVTTASNSGLTCNPVTYTIKACADMACAPYTPGVTGTLTLAGATPQSSVAFNIGPSGQTSVEVYTTTAANITASIATGTLNTLPSNSPAVFCGMGAGATSGGSCVYRSAAAGFILNVPNHAAGEAQTVLMKALQSSASNSTQCVAAFKNVSKSVRLTCSYGNPNDGTMPVVVNGSGLNAGGQTGLKCDGQGASLNLPFDGNGSTTLTVQYDDAGQVNLAANHVGTGSHAGLTLSGGETFVTAPKRFVIATAGPYIAGQGYTGSVTAMSANNTVTANFGKELPTAATTFTQTVSRPTGSGAKAGTLGGSLGAFNNGVATLNSLSWTEVGSLDFTVVTTNYLGSGLDVNTSTGTAGAVGPFVPHRFDVAVTQACAASGKSAFTYAGQPFAVSVTARALGGGLTQNYDGSANTSPNQARSVNITAITNAATGELSGASVPVTAFVGGTATATPSFAFTNKATTPTVVRLRATEALGTVSSSAGAEGSVSLRSGRLKLFNAFGSGRTPLALQAQTQHWSGRGWVLNSDDDCTTVPAAALIMARYFDERGAESKSPWGQVTASGFAASSGQGSIVFSAPTGGSTGSIDIAANLGDTDTDASCLPVHPKGGKAQRAWLRSSSIGTSCTGSGPFDPSARITFGVHAPETRKLMHAQDLY
jgi:hypothetical protein